MLTKGVRLRRRPLQTADQEFALVDHFFWQVVVEFDEKFFVAYDLAGPLAAIEFLQRVKLFWSEGQALPFHVRVAGHPADGSFVAERTAFDAVDNPLEDAHIVAEIPAT